MGLSLPEGCWHTWEQTARDGLRQTEIKNRDVPDREMLTAKETLLFLSKEATQFSQEPQPICPRRTGANLKLFLFYPVFFFLQIQHLSFRNRTIRETFISGTAKGK